MKYTASYLIKKRKEKWNELHDIEYDKRFRYAVANEMLSNKELLEEIKNNPEKLIELVFVVVDKNQTTMPFFLNEVQQEFIDTLNKAREDYDKGIITDISLLILKGRQQGFTTLVTAYQLATSILHKNFQGFTLADNSDNTEAIFQNKAKFPHSQLPEILKPSEKFNNKRQLLFEKLNSSWAVDTATKNVGRSRTINFFHGSECAFWKDGIASVQAALGEAFTKNCIKIYESTANGYNDYQKMWDSGVHINCFYEWWKTKEYRITIPNEEIKQEFIDNIDKKNEWIYTRLKWLRDEIKLDLEQLYWYYKKYESYLDKDLIKQEYPCSPREAFLLSGATVFDTEKLLERQQQLPKPLKVGYFAYDYDGQKISNIRWVNDRNGYIKLYRLPDTPVMAKYCIGGDTAGEGSDYYVGYVIDAKTGEQVAKLRHQFDPDQYTRQMYCLGKYYSYFKLNKREDALIAIETNFDTYPIRELQRLGYENQYIREKIDEYTGKKEKRFGFKTTRLTRPTIIGQLIEIVREHTELINDEDTINELLTIIRNEEGRIEAPVGGHDDIMMAAAIAYEARTQIEIKDNTMTPEEQMFKEFNIEFRDDYGEEIVVV